MLLDKIDDLLKEVSQLSAKNAEDVEQLRIKYLSKKGEISELMDEFRSVAKDKKKSSASRSMSSRRLQQKESTSCAKRWRRQRPVRKALTSHALLTLST